MPNLSEGCRTLVLDLCTDAKTNVDRVMQIIEEILRTLCDQSSTQLRSHQQISHTDGLNCLADIESCLEIVKKLDLDKGPPVKSNRLANAFELVMKSPPVQLQQFRDASIFLPGNDIETVLRYARLVPELTKVVRQLKVTSMIELDSQDSSGDLGGSGDVAGNGSPEETSDTVLVMGAPARSNLTRREKIRRHALIIRPKPNTDEGEI